MLHMISVFTIAIGNIVQKVQASRGNRKMRNRIYIKRL